MGLFSKKQRDFDEIRNEKEDASLKRVSELFVQVSNSTDDTPREGFKQALKQRILEARGKKSMKFNPFSRRMFTVLAAGGSTAVVVLIISMLVIEPVMNVVPMVYAQDNFTLTAEAADSLGVDPESTFLLESRSAIDVQEITPLLANNLEVPFTLSAIDEFSIRIELEEALQSDEVIQFSLSSEIETISGDTKPRVYQWAFQAQSQFHVTTSVPGHQATYVPVDAGIEITFSHDNVSVEDFEDALTIEPAVPGRAEKYRRSLVWVPDQPLETQTFYTVTLSGDLSPDGSDLSLGEEYVIEFETDAEESRYAYYYLREHSISTSPDIAPGVGVSYNRNYAEQMSGAVFSVYSFETDEAFAQALSESTVQSWRAYLQANDLVDVDELIHVGDFDAVFDEEASYGSENLALPEALEEGYYFAYVQIDDQELPLFIQSSTLAVTVVDAQNQSLAWVHDLETGEALRGAEVSVFGSDDAATTGSDGVAVFATDEDLADGAVYQVSYGSDVTYVRLEAQWAFSYEGYSFGWFNSIYNDNFWSFLSTDRPVYLNDDTVKVFGAVEDRESGEVPETVRVWVNSGSSYRTVTSGVVIAETEVELSEEGTFTAELKLPGVAVNSYGASVVVSYGEENVVYKHIGITEYQKPVMALDVDVEELAAWSNDEVNYSITGSYFDGTPAAWQEVSVTTPSASQVEIQLDENGVYEGSFIAPSSAYFTRGLYRRQTVSAYTLTPGSGEVTDQDYYYQFDSTFEIEQDGEVSLEEGVVNVEVFNVDLSGIEDVDSYSPDEELYQSDLRAGTELSYTVTEHWYEKEENGTTYDPISKTVRQLYRYNRQEAEVATGSVATDENGQVSFTYTPDREDAYYKVSITGAGDDDNSHVSTSTYRIPGNRTNSYDNYTLQWDNPEADDSGASPTYSVGDTVELNVYQNDEVFEMPEGSSFLFLQAQMGVQEYDVSTDSTYTFEFEEHDAPNVTAHGILFLENGYLQIGSSWSSGYSVKYDKDDSELTIEIETDSDEYAPGDEAEIDVTVTDVYGNPVEADVNISIVDEAYFALFEADPNPINGLYQTVTSGIRSVQTSHDASPEEASADGKGGGGGDARMDFVDTAAFVTIHTDRNGTGSTTVDLADNITSWRIIAQGYDGDERLGGAGKKNVSTTLPFFIRASVQESYLDGDEPNLYVFSAGTELELGEEVRYDFEMEAPEIALSTTALVGEEVAFSLPDLAVGEYRVTIVGVYDDYSDAIELPVTIVDSRLTKPSVLSIDLEDEVVPEIETDGAFVTFVDSGAGQYYSRLRQFDWWFGDRADEVAARYAAQTILNDVFEEDVNVSDVLMSVYQPDGMIRLLEHAEEDLVLTAKIAMLGDTPFDELDMVDILAEVIDTENSEGVLTAEERAWAYTGLAALGEVRLSDIQRLAEEDLVDEERLITALALYFAGDHESARVIYRDLMVDSVDWEIGMAYWSADLDEDRAEKTVLLGILAAGLQEDGLDELDSYLVTQSAGKTLINVEEMVMIKQALNHASEEVSRVAFTLNGSVERVDLPKGESASWYLNADQIAELEPEVEAGDVTMVIAMQVPLSLTDNVYDKISVEREYLNIYGGPIRGEMLADEIIQVRITYDVDNGLPNGAYQITDVLPSGLTPLTSQMRSYRGEDYCISYPIGDTDQVITFTVYDEMYRHSSCWKNTVTYYARVMNSGTFEVEPTVIRSLDDVSLINFSEGIEILTIND